ncbi:MAG: hypothetical protein PW845_24780 [Pseudomonas sp.]|nr:hypothetical protein [Pseudomonas sp.]
MTAESRVTAVVTHLSQYLAYPDATLEIETSVEALNFLATELQEITPAIQQLSDLNAAFTLVSQLLDAAHTDKLDADQMKCLLDPLTERLALASSAIAQALN